MLTPKKIAVPALVGFILSFSVSLISTHRLSSSLFRGLIFGVLFAALFLLIDFLFSKFLEEGSDVEVGSPKKSQGEGNHVDLTISDEGLSDDGQNLKFSVANYRKPLDDSKLQKGLSDLKDDVESAGPSLKNETPADFMKAAKETVATAATVAAEKQDENKKNFVPSAVPGVAASSEEAVPKNEIDSLPDIGSFVQSSDGNGSGDGEIVDDTEFASSGVALASSGRSTFADGSKASDHDAETMAKAISTVLKRDE